MKRILWTAAVIAAVWGLPRLSHPAVDIGKLDPVETVLLKVNEDEIALETDSGAKGSGKTLKEAIRDLKEGTEMEVYLDTTNKLLIYGDAGNHWKDIMETFRPSCYVCKVQNEVDLKKATEYLSTHKPRQTLNRLYAEQNEIQVLITEEGRWKLEP